MTPRAPVNSLADDEIGGVDVAGGIPGGRKFNRPVARLLQTAGAAHRPLDAERAASALEADSAAGSRYGDAAVCGGGKRQGINDGLKNRLILQGERCGIERGQSAAEGGRRLDLELRARTGRDPRPEVA